MRTIISVLCLFVLMVFAPYANAQIVNLQVNGSSTSFTFVSGSDFSWEYNLPNGGTAVCELWLDTNLNGSIDPETDHLYLSFAQIDGAAPGSGGPPDVDGSVNGHVSFSGKVGIAPGTFVMKFSHGGTSMQVPGTVTALASPAHTISGKVLVPAGRSPQYIVIEASRDKDYEPNFWHGLTDASGNYVVQTDADTAGGPWYVRVSDNPFPPAVISPERATVSLGANPTGIDFTLEMPNAIVNGWVEDENGLRLPECEVFLNRNDGGVNRNVRSDMDGLYETGIMAGEMNGQTWRIQTGDGNLMSSTTLIAQRQLPAIQNSGTFFRKLVVYSVNSQIQGQVRINGFSPWFPVHLMAWNADTAQISAQADGAGNFSIGVSSLISTYDLFPIDLGFPFSNQNVTAHPGDTGVQINITTTSVEDPAPTAPERFALEQNYPNPFNPSTTISFSLPTHSYVQLKVNNLLGQESATLVNGMLGAGRHTVQFDASRLPSGFYFYRLTAGSFTSTKSMIILK